MTMQFWKKRNVFGNESKQIIFDFYLPKKSGFYNKAKIN